MVSADLIYLLFHFTDFGCPDLYLPGTFLRMRNPLFRHISDHRSN